MAAGCSNVGFPPYSSVDVTRFGLTHTGKQRYRCHGCKRTFCDNPATRQTERMHRAQLLTADQERCAARGLVRVFGLLRNTLSGWLKKYIHLLALATTPLPHDERETLALDEI